MQCRKLLSKAGTGFWEVVMDQMYKIDQFIAEFEY